MERERSCNYVHKIHHKQAAAGHCGAAAGLYGLYNAISCFVTLYKAGHQPYLMAGAVRFDFQGYYMMAAMHVGICLLLGVLVWLFLKGTKKLREKTAVR